MAKTSMVNRDIKRKKLVKKFASKRAELKAIIASTTRFLRRQDGCSDQAAEAAARLVASRVRNRCELTGRSRGVYAKFGLGRNKLREATMRGDVPGLRKASW